jgi:hypothetical protein
MAPPSVAPSVAPPFKTPGGKPLALGAAGSH